jgi:hypothetical protein
MAAKKSMCVDSKIDLARAVYSAARCLDAGDLAGDMKAIKKIFTPIKNFHATPCAVFSRKKMGTGDQLDAASTIMKRMSKSGCKLIPDEDDVIGYAMMDIEYRKK